ncbi:hypothetical protein J5N97_019980 [Dioscorea zingiberensis]|uniref:Zinc-ribbon 15 domain-containing protein n=1 Tax=Dioscorea zingiberensis TaxID=325984 RepID=A0A9D5CEV7_9LILI|nr:hypothetical protein J5N97_019980 [Dioscorea zingiberensis]
MFFFFVGGLEQQAGRVISERVGRCIRCGSAADLVEREKVLKLFFVPVWRWRSEARDFYCRDCGLLWPQSMESFDEKQRSIEGVLRCGNCDRVVESEFKFCPFCGSEL